ncbi:MAG: diguanylate cyclase [Planctomycetota bacterium]|jgi:diguanylate cyclase (GGDEF)-like protein
MNYNIKIIAINDEADNVGQLEECLAQMPDSSFSWSRCTAVDSAWDEITSENVDLIILDYDQGGTAGTEFLSKLRKEQMLIPVIATTASSDPYLAAEITRAGADEYIAKEDIAPDALLHLIEVAMERAQTRMLEQRLAQKQQAAAAELAELNAELAQIGRTDSLTSLLNRGAWNEAIELEHERSTRHGHPYSVIIADIDHFKSLNDTQGHQAGDEVLAQVASCIAECCRRIDMVGRYGGEEFVALLPETDLGGAELLAGRIRERIYHLNIPHKASSVADRVTISAGVACAGSGSWESVIRVADEALYRAKASGRNRVCSERTVEYPVEPTNSDKQLILAVDDDEQYVKILHRHLTKVPNLNFELMHCMTAAAARDLVMNTQIDTVFIDYLLGKERGTEVLKSLRSTGFLGPVIVLTGHGDQYIAAKLMRYGADDYLVKSDLTSKILQKTMDTAKSQCRKRSVELENRTLLEKLKNTNEELEAKNERLAGINNAAYEFVEHVFEELRQPLTTITDMAGTLRKGLAGEVSSAQSSKLGLILNRADDLNCIFDDMLDMTKLEAGFLSISRHMVTPKRILQGVHPKLARKAGASDISLDIDIENTDQQVYCDVERTGRIILNLVKNAVDASTPGDTISIWARADHQEGLIRFGIADQGEHLTDTQLCAIRRGFQQCESGIRGNARGFRLGLKIARDLTHLNYGDMHVENREQRGRLFLFTIPFAGPATLIPRYVDKAQWFRSGNKFWHVHEVKIDGAVEESQYRELSRMMQYQIRCNDLLLPLDSKSWILIAASNRSSSTGMIKRVRTVIGNNGNSGSGEPPPPLTFQRMGTFDADHQKDELLRCIRRITNTGSLVATSH